jgi:hypothetical protein
MAGPVVPETIILDEQEFQGRLVAGFSRCIVGAGKPRFALDLGMSTRGLDKVLAGSTPKGHSIFNVRSRHPTALDELLTGYRSRIVPDSAVCSTDQGAGLKLIRAAAKCIEAEADGQTDHLELLGMEVELREAAALIAGRLARIDRLKGTGGS